MNSQTESPVIRLGVSEIQHGTAAMAGPWLRSSCQSCVIGDLPEEGAHAHPESFYESPLSTL